MAAVKAAGSCKLTALLVLSLEDQSRPIRLAAAEQLTMTSKPSPALQQVGSR